VQAGKAVHYTAKDSWEKRGVGTSNAAGFVDGPRDFKVVPTAPMLCLLGRVGDQDPPVALGTSGSFTPEVSGRLYVQANELDLAEMSGAIQLEIRGGKKGADSIPAPPPTRVQETEQELRRLLPVPAAPAEVEKRR